MWATIRRYPKRLVFFIAISIVPIFFLLFYTLSHYSKNESDVVLERQDSVNVVTAPTTEREHEGSASGFFIPLILIGVAGSIWRMVKGRWPHILTMAILASGILFNWLWWSIHPASWQEWRNSSSFWPLIFSMFIVAFLSGESNPVAKFARGALLGLVIVSIAIGVTSYARKSWCWAASDEAKAQLCATTYSSTSTVSLPAKFDGHARDYFNGPERDSVLAYFHDIPVLADIAGAESGFRQYNNGSPDRSCSTVLRNKNTNGTEDMGVMQINEVHWGKAKELGHDLCLLKGNMAFARHLYEQDGTQPWEASSPVWRDHYVSVPRSTSSTQIAVGGGNTVTVIAPSDSSWSTPIDTKGRRTRCEGIQHKKYRALIDRKREFQIEPGAFKNVGQFRLIQFRSDSSEATEVSCTVG